MYWSCPLQEKKKNKLYVGTLVTSSYSKYSFKPCMRLIAPSTGKISLVYLLKPLRDAFNLRLIFGGLPKHSLLHQKWKPG